VNSSLRYTQGDNSQSTHDNTVCVAEVFVLAGLVEAEGNGIQKYNQCNEDQEWSRSQSRIEQNKRKVNWLYQNCLKTAVMC